MGTTNMVSSAMVIPPKTGIAIGTMMSDPRPVLVSTGNNASKVVAVVIRHGLTLSVPASITVSLMALPEVGPFFSNLCLR